MYWKTIKLACWEATEAVAAAASMVVASVAVSALNVRYPQCIGGGAIFRLGEQKLVKYNQDSHIQSINLCIFSKKDICGVQWGLGQSPQKLGSFRDYFCVKSNLTVCKL